MTFTKIPWGIGKKALRWLLVYYIVSLLVIGSSFRVFIHNNIDATAPWVYKFLGELDRYFLYTFWSLVFVSGFFFLIFIWQFFYPLGVLLEKGKEIKKGNFKKRNGVDLEESRGEWFLLDLTLNKIYKDLKRKKADIEKERGELEALVTAANDAILAVDKDLSIRYYNSPMALLFDQKEEGNWGKSIKEVFRNQKVIAAFEKSLEDNTPQRVQASQPLSIDSAMHYFDISISPLINDKKNKTRGAVAIFHDVTEHKKTEKIRVDFVANASHELKTPVTLVKGYLDLIKSKSDLKDEELDAAFNVIDKNMNRLNRLVSDLLDLSKIESSDDVEKELIDVEEMTESILGELSSQILDKNQVIEKIYDIKSISAHRDYLEQTIINIIENAIKYCPRETKIKIRWDEIDGFGRLSIKDNGPGIESFHQGRLFERFYRVRDKENQQIQGTGLGLSIVRHAMQKQGGHVDVRSTSGLGTDFICFFPKD